MRAKVAQYLNEIVSLTILGLMCLALVAGQAGAAQADRTEIATAPAEAAIIDTVDRIDGTSFLEDRLRLIDGPEFKVDITFSFRHTGE